MAIETAHYCPQISNAASSLLLSDAFETVAGGSSSGSNDVAIEAAPGQKEAGTGSETAGVTHPSQSYVRIQTPDHLVTPPSPSYVTSQILACCESVGLLHTARTGNATELMLLLCEVADPGCV